MSKQKKTQQLGMNPSTASGRLVKDILFKLAIDAGHKCYRCGGDLDRDTFSIEHKEPWLDSKDPKGLYFDQANIAFSHLKCNVGSARQNNKGVITHGTNSGYDHHGCRCDLCKNAKSVRAKTTYNTPEKRRMRYDRTGN